MYQKRTQRDDRRSLPRSRIRLEQRQKRPIERWHAPRNAIHRSTESITKRWKNLQPISSRFHTQNETVNSIEYARRSTLEISPFEAAASRLNPLVLAAGKFAEEKKVIKNKRCGY